MSQGRKPKYFYSPYSVEEEQKLARAIASCKHDPFKFSMFNYPWGEEDLKGFMHPKGFQQDVMQAVKEHLSNPLKRFTPLQLGISSGKGIGKTALIALLTNWGLSTFMDTKARLTANTETQLRLIVWPELRKWFNLGLNAHWFDATATSISSKIPGHEASWGANAVTWSEHNMEAFAGFHNYGKRLIAIVDEGSGIADGVFHNIEGFLTDADTELLVFVFGNPTKNYGFFHSIFKEDQKYWVTFKIDSRTVEGINEAQIKKLIEEHGIDSDIVKVTILGEFPESSFEQFIPEIILDAAFDRGVTRESQKDHPCIIGVDPAHSRDDVAIVARQGNWTRVLEVFKKSGQDDDDIIGEKVLYWEDELEADAVFIDLGYGTGVKLYGKMKGRPYWELVAFGGGSIYKEYKNKRSEMYGKMKQALREGLCLGGDKQLKKELGIFERRTSREGTILLESKDDAKERLKSEYESPGRADALSLTWARPVVKKRRKTELEVFKETFSPEDARFQVSLDNVDSPLGAL